MHTFAAMRLTVLFQGFFQSERAGGIILVLCAFASLVLTNSPAGEAYAHLWHRGIAGPPLEFWINDGLMTVFFLLVGLELERELYLGELSRRDQALLPVLAALGGMLVPAGIHAMLNSGTPTASGAGIPMATDIAFAIGILSLLGDRVPVALKVFLTALAVIDDLGAIIAIAVFYSHDLSPVDLGLAAATYMVLLALGRMKVNILAPYLILGAVLWYFMQRSGVHPTVSGVLLAFAIPFGKGGERAISHRLQKFLHKPVAFFIMPVFALANTCIRFEPGWSEGLLSANSLGIALGLVLGKPIGIAGFTAVAVAAGWCALPNGTRPMHIIGVGFLGGIGFTMSIFITLLAFGDQATIAGSKTAILLGSFVAAIIGALWLRAVLLRPRDRKTG